MIRLHRADVPEQLATRIAERTARFLQLSANGEAIPEALANAYKDPAVKELLRTETSDKCAYCESKIPHVDYGDVEHIIPKVVQPELRFAYENLTYACGVCNTKKGQYFNEEQPLLNPYLDDPSDHLVAMGPMVLRHPTSDSGLVTEKRLQLNRAALVERRAERLEAIASLMDQIARATIAAVKEVLLEQVRLECGSDKEYSFVVRSYVKAANELATL